jgi:hypothetical protein
MGAVPKAMCDGLFHGRACFGRAAEDAGETREVLVVLPEQDGEESRGRDEAVEAAAIIDDGERAFAVLCGLPCSAFLVDAGRDGRRVGVHDRREGVVFGRGEEILDRDDADEPIAITHGCGAGVVEALLDDAAPQLAGRGHRCGDGDAAGGEAASRFDGEFFEGGCGCEHRWLLRLDSNAKKRRRKGAQQRFTTERRRNEGAVGESTGRERWPSSRY